MGWGDELIASGLARRAAARGKRAAFGDGQRIIWSGQAGELFRGNPHVAPPGDEHADDLQWIEHYRGNRLYRRVPGGGVALMPGLQSLFDRLLAEATEAGLGIERYRREPFGEYGLKRYA